MAGTNYPDKIDTDAELPRIDDNITETGSDTLNAMREAIFGIQKALGINPQGAAADLKTRLSQSLNEDGTLKTAALVISGLVNSQVAAGAAIVESKLNLDYTTQELQDQIWSNDIDIAELQKRFGTLILNFNDHIAGIYGRHDSFDIDLDSDYVGSTPPSFANVSATNVGDMLIEINDRFIQHASSDTIGAHKASNISVDGSNFQLLDSNIDDVQEALEAIDLLRATEFIVHRDHMHANGFDNWANNTSGYNENSQKVPDVLGQTVTALLVPGYENRIRFTGYDLASELVEQGDVVVITDGYSVGSYIIDDVGPRSGTLGAKPSLLSSEVEIVGTFVDGYMVVDGYVEAQIFSASSQFTYKSNGAITFHQSGVTLDSVQISRPNSAKVISLGIRPDLIDGTEQLDLEVGLSDGSSRTISVTNLDQDRSGPVSKVTVDTVVDRINSVLQGSDNFPAAAYRVGDELMLSHNWDGYVGNYLKVNNSSTAGTVLGLDGYGANVLDLSVYPTKTSAYYVGGNRLSSFKRILFSTDNSVTGTTITFNDGNPLGAGVKVGHLIHVEDHAIVDENGTYFVTGVTDTTVTIHTGISATSGLTIEVVHDAVPMAEFVNSNDSLIIETFVDREGQAGYNARLIYDKTITNLDVLNVSDNHLAGTYVLRSEITSGGHNLYFDTYGWDTFVPTGFTGELKVYSEANISWVEVRINGALSTGAADVTVNKHIDEEELLELATVRSNGLETLFDIVDRRLFGSIGLDEIREDVIQAYIETPLVELRSNGIVRGFEVLQYGPAVDFVYPSNDAILYRGGSIYVNGVRSDVPTLPVAVPNTAGTFYVCLNQLGTYSIIDDADYSLEDILDGKAGQYTTISKYIHNGTNITSIEDLRYYINNLDAKIDLIVDATNHMIGSFNTVEAAINYANSYPSSEKFVVRVSSYEPINVSVPSSSRDITLELDGYVQNVTLQADCRIVNRGMSNRAQAHINGTLTATSGCTRLEVAGIGINGAVTIGGVLEYVKFENCDFSGTFTSTGTSIVDLKFRDCNLGGQDYSIGNSNAHIVVDSCSGIGGLFSIESSETVKIHNCVFDTKRVFLNGVGAVTDTLFKNHTLDSLDCVQTDSANILFSNCMFTDITMSTSGSVLYIVENSRVESCVFSGCVLNNTTYLIKIDDGGIVKNNIFNTNTYATSTPSVICENFEHNIKIDSSEMLVQAYHSFVGNDNVTAVTGPSAPSTKHLKTVSNNIFPTSSTFGYSVDLAFANTPTDAEHIVSNNYFQLASGQDGIICGSNTKRVKVIGNHFYGQGATSNGIALANAGVSTSSDIVIASNTFNASTAMTDSGLVKGVTLSNNKLGGENTSVQVGDGWIIEANSGNGAVLTIGGSGASNVFIANNQFIGTGGALTISAPLTSSGIHGNTTTSGITISATLNDTIISSNHGNIIVSGSPQWSRVLFTENMGGVTSGAPVWYRSLISENYFSAASVTFTMKSDLSNTPAYVNISDNIFAEDIVLSAINAIDKVWFTDNFSIGSTPLLSISSTINDAIISGNIDIGMAISTGANSCLVSNNILKDADLTLNGSVATTVLNGNSTNNIIVDCDSPVGLNIVNNAVFGVIDIFSTSGNYAVSGMKVNNNRAVTIRVGNGTTGTDVVSFTDSRIDGNTVTDIKVFPTGFDTVRYTFTGNSVSGNTASNNIELLSDTGGASYYNAVNPISLSDISLNSNNVTGQIKVSGGSSSATDNIAYSRIIVNNNVIEGGLEFAGYAQYSQITISNNSIYASGVAGIVLRLSGAGASVDLTYSDININSNSVYSDTGRGIDFTIPGTGLSGTSNIDRVSVANNLLYNMDFAIDLASSSALSALLINGVIVTGNIMRTAIFRNRSTVAAVMFPTSISVTNNIFVGNIAGAGIHASSTWQPGVFLDHSNSSGAVSFNGLTVSNNSAVTSATEILISSTSSTGTNCTVVYSVISNNSNCNVTIYEGGTSVMYVQSTSITSNAGGDLDISSLSSANAQFIGLVIGGNRYTNIYLGDKSAFLGDNLIYFNIASWTTSGTFTTGGTTNVFVWGNTGSFTGVTFGGTTAVNCNTANGNAITC